MLSFQTQYTQAQDMAQDSSAPALVFLKRNLNIGLHLLESELGTHILEEERTGSTVADTNYIQLPENCIRVQAFFVTVSNIEYNCQEVFDEDTWRRLQMSSSSSRSNFAQYFYVRRNKLYFYPTPSSINTYTLIYEAESKDLSQDDYTTGTITTLANAGTAVTGSGTSFTSAMIGRFIKINDDGQWYEISAVGSTTGLTLLKPYQGTAISAGSSAFTIGEMPKIPSPTHHIPTYFALWQYFEGYKKDSHYATLYKQQWEQYLQWAKSTYSRRYSTQVIPDQRYIHHRGLLDPNDFPRDVA